MAVKEGLIGELRREAGNTRIMIERLKEEHFGWKPHEKSYSVLALAKHMANIPVWIDYIVTRDHYDITHPIANAGNIATVPALLDFFDQRLANAVAILESADEEMLNQQWTFKRGEFVVYNLPKKVAIRYMVLNHIVHHRGQLSVYLRILNLPVPGMYGPSADELG
jgi:uncharacterized damage-inducible protein DinB